MKITFAQELLQFVESMDIVNRYIFSEIEKIIDEYTKSKLDIDKVKIMKIYIEDNKNILKKFTLKNIATNNISIKPIKRGQMPYIIKQKEPATAWITSAVKDELLINAKSYVDHYLGLKNIPKFVRGGNRSQIKTSIIVPFFESKKGIKFIQGVVSYESTKYLEYSEESRKEIEDLTEAISKLMYSYDVYIKQSFNTNEALEKIKKKYEHYKLLPKVKNQIFLAYAENSESDVVNSIKEVIEQDFKNVAYYDWKDNNTTGIITKEIFTQIEESKYGICYFSEINEAGGYKDNINVMFEAGIMHSKPQYKNMWIPIREKDSPPKAFDISLLNHIEIERENGKFDKEAFKSKLRDMLKTMIEEG